ncbi:MAG TPA: DUF4446 family protein [Actinomycetes bacterium]|nr:DUF4446 family protein [Actinomycetes bacterium]
MPLDPQTLDLLAIGGVALGLLGLTFALVANRRIGRLRRSYDLLQGDGRSDDFVTAVERQIDAVEALRAEVHAARRENADTRQALEEAIRHVAVVRYDAFSDMGGRMSFSVALLDDDGDGLVLTTITGRRDTRTYAKGLRGGRSDQALSPEEEQAIAFALESAPGHAAVR